MCGDESQGVPLLASCQRAASAHAFAVRASYLLNSNRLREQVYGRWKELPYRATSRHPTALYRGRAGHRRWSQVRGGPRLSASPAGSLKPNPSVTLPSVPSPPPSSPALLTVVQTNPPPIRHRAGVNGGELGEVGSVRRDVRTRAISGLDGPVTSAARAHSARSLWRVGPCGCRLDACTTG